MRGLREGEKGGVALSGEPRGPVLLAGVLALFFVLLLVGILVSCANLLRWYLVKLL
jgi:hypothetical protein